MFNSYVKFPEGIDYFAIFSTKTSIRDFPATFDCQKAKSHAHDLEKYLITIEGKPLRITQN